MRQVTANLSLGAILQHLLPWQYFQISYYVTVLLWCLQAVGLWHLWCFFFLFIAVTIAIILYVLTRDIDCMQMSCLSCKRYWVSQNLYWLSYVITYRYTSSQFNTILLKTNKIFVSEPSFINTYLTLSKSK